MQDKHEEDRFAVFGELDREGARGGGLADSAYHVESEPSHATQYAGRTLSADKDPLQ